MDPQAAWDQLLEAFAEQDWPAVYELAESLLAWLDRSGFPPQSHARALGAEWDEVVTRAACTFALEHARRRGGSP